jgi:catechol 2,3-dioxygenase-like lactoylglutathione lyase family enzyme
MSKQTAATDKETLANLDSINHVAIAVDDVATAVEWYTSKFRCQIEYQDKTWAFLCFGNIKLALVVPNQHPPHVAFVSAAAETYGVLKKHRDGTRSCYVKDPAGNSVEIMDAESV